MHFKRKGKLPGKRAPLFFLFVSFLVHFRFFFFFKKKISYGHFFLPFLSHSLVDLVCFEFNANDICHGGKWKFSLGLKF